MGKGMVAGHNISKRGLYTGLAFSLLLCTHASYHLQGNLSILYLLELYGAWIRQEINERCSPRAEQNLINPDDTSNGFVEELIGTLELCMILIVNDDRRVSDR